MVAVVFSIEASFLIVATSEFCEFCLLSHALAPLMPRDAQKPATPTSVSSLTATLARELWHDSWPHSRLVSEMCNAF